MAYHEGILDKRWQDAMTQKFQALKLIHALNIIELVPHDKLPIRCKCVNNQMLMVLLKD